MKKVGWPDFPFNDWQSIKKWDIASLRDIAAHLQQRTGQARILCGSGYQGATTEMEKQLVQHISALHERACALENTVQALLQSSTITGHRSGHEGPAAGFWKGSTTTRGD